MGEIMNRQSKLVVTLGLAITTTLGSIACGPAPSPKPAPAPDNAVLGPFYAPPCMKTGADIFKACCYLNGATSVGSTCNGGPTGNSFACTAYEFGLSGSYSASFGYESNKPAYCCNADSQGNYTIPAKKNTFSPNTPEIKTTLSNVDTSLLGANCPSFTTKEDVIAKYAPKDGTQMCINNINTQNINAILDTMEQSPIKSVVSGLIGKTVEEAKCTNEK